MHWNHDRQTVRGVEWVIWPDRMLDALNEDLHAGPQRMLQQVQDSIDRFVRQAPHFDDLTMLVLVRNQS